MKKLLLLWGLLPVALWGQVELNVKFSAPTDPLTIYLSARAEGVESLPSSALRSAHPWVTGLQKSQTLRARPTTPAAEIANIYTLALDSASASNALEALRRNSGVEWVERNQSRQIHGLERSAGDPPNDDSVARQWYHPFIETFAAWDSSRGAGIRIGVIDTGLDFEHPEFENQLWINPLEDVNGNGRFDPWPADETRNGTTGDFDGLDNDGNGFPDDVVGYDFADQPRSPFGGDYVEPDPFPADDNAHGSVVAGIIHARANNDWGGAGVAPASELMVLRAFVQNGSGEDDDIARAIIYAVDNGAQVLNFSFGDIYPSRVMLAAVRYAYARGVVMVASAGNGTGDELHYPSGFDETISVSATTRNPENGREFLWPLSSYGLTVDLAAPGADILTPTLQDTAIDGSIARFGRFSGTSASAPLVAGGAALLIAQRGPLTPEQIRGILTSSADDIGEAGWDHLTGAGRLNLKRALVTVGASQVKILSPQNDAGSAQASVWVMGRVLDPQFRFWSLSYQAGTQGTGDWVDIIAEQTTQARNDTLGRWELDTLDEGEYTLRLRVTRSDGFQTEDRIRFEVDRSAPEIELRRNAPIWDNHLRRHFLVFRDSDRGRHTLFFRPQGGNFPWRQVVSDRATRNGEFLLDETQLETGSYEAFIRGENAAGLVTSSDTFIIDYTYEAIYRGGWNLKPYSGPMGRFLPESYDLDGDGRREFILSEFDDQLNFGPTRQYEFDGTGFQAIDSLAFRSVLLPKDLVETPGGFELLASANDSLYVLRSTSGLPDQIVYQQFGQGLFAASFDDVDDDGEEELLAKNFIDYFIFEKENDAYRLADSLGDFTPNYVGSVAPRPAVADFDGDGKTETAFGDFDGDFIVWEHDGGGGYEVIFLDTTALTKSGSYLTAGDFDGDGNPELFVAVHGSPLRNADFEYDPAYWWLRIFKSVGDNNFSIVWEDYLYDLDQETFNAATAAQLDADPAEELVFTTFPRTYVLEYGVGGYHFSWFLFGTLATHHVAGDFDGNGLPEVGIGRGDSTFFWEKNGETVPLITSMQGVVAGSETLRLNWPEQSGADAYLVIFQPDSGGSTFGVTTPFPEVELTRLDSGVPYRVAALSIAGGDTAAVGIVLTRKPHAFNRVDSVEVVGDRQLRLFFSQPMSERERDKAFFRLDDQRSPDAISGTRPGARVLLLSFGEAFAPGAHRLNIDSMLLDNDFGLYDPRAEPIAFVYTPDSKAYLYLTAWDAAGDREAELRFNLPLDVETLRPENFGVEPFGRAVEVVPTGDPRRIRVRIEGATLGALGYPVSIIVQPAVCGADGVCVRAYEGNVATFSDFRETLDEVFAYPNPVAPHEVFDGMRFGNLTQQARIRVLTTSGRLVVELEEEDGDGGLTWDLRDGAGVRIRPGVYLYQVTNSAGDEFFGKFSVLE